METEALESDDWVPELKSHLCHQVAMERDDPSLSFPSVKWEGNGPLFPGGTEHTELGSEHAVAPTCGEAGQQAQGPGLHRRRCT